MTHDIEDVERSGSPGSLPSKEGVEKAPVGTFCTLMHLNLPIAVIIPAAVKLEDVAEFDDPNIDKDAILLGVYLPVESHDVLSHPTLQRTTPPIPKSALR